jgi:hypothetical protein
LARLEEIIVMNKVNVPIQVIDQTLSELQNAGREDSERVVLWLGRRNDEAIEVNEVFVPLQYAERDYFRIPKDGMAALLRHLREERLMIAAQVHSHPEIAFHSGPDDYWAIVRHVGALSLVLPCFALRTDNKTFARDAVVFELSPNNEWLEVASTRVHDYYIINS